MGQLAPGQARLTIEVDVTDRGIVELRNDGRQTTLTVMGWDAVTQSTTIVVLPLSPANVKALAGGLLAAQQIPVRVPANGSAASDDQ